MHISHGIRHRNSNSSGFGELTSQTGNPVDSSGFAGAHGYESDAPMGLQLLGQRYYDPYVGRFLNPDPIGLAGGLNLYGYCVGDPVNLVDPEGLDWIDDNANFSGGWGDALTLGGTKWLRRWVGEAYGFGDANQAIDYDSGFYTAGGWVGTVHTTAFGGWGGWKLAGAPGPGLNFSHWIPNRFLERLPAGKFRDWAVKRFGKSLWNGNYVDKLRHFNHDLYATVKGMTRKEKTWWSLRQQLDRVPRVYYGGIAGFAYGRLHRLRRGRPCN